MLLMTDQRRHETVEVFAQKEFSTQACIRKFKMAHPKIRAMIAHDPGLSTETAVQQKR
jgi:hypothetical protein